MFSSSLLLALSICGTNETIGMKFKSLTIVVWLRPRVVTSLVLLSSLLTSSLSAVVVGADRVVANGDTANKVGTYQLAIAAKHHGIPFYVAAPSTSCDLSLESGRDIIIEVRPPEELTSINGVPIAAPGKECGVMGMNEGGAER